MSNINELMLEMDVMMIAESMKKRDYKGKNNPNYKHGYKGKKLYRVWYDMLGRCLKPTHKSYKDYGGRGITISKEFIDLKSFFEWGMVNGYKEGLQLDRRDNSKGYSPENCRFVTRLVNMNNTRSRKKQANLPVGVVQHRKKFQARIKMHNQEIYLGTWSTPDEASKQYNCVKRIYLASIGA